MSPSGILLPLLYPEALGNGCAQFTCPSLFSHFPAIYHGFFDIKNLHQRIHTHHVVIIVIIAVIVIINVEFVLFHMSHATLLLYYHASMLTLQTFFNITCTLVATGMILGRLHCIGVALFLKACMWYQISNLHLGRGAKFRVGP